MRLRPFSSLLLAIVALAAAATPVNAASRLVVRGAGFGHGVGMSQYGALGFANNGRDHAFILGHYYAGTQLGKLAGASEVRVLLRNAASVSFSGATRVAGDRALDPAQTYVGARALDGTSGSMKRRMSQADEARSMWMLARVAHLMRGSLLTWRAPARWRERR